jgi:hypothetical protein
MKITYFLLLGLLNIIFAQAQNNQYDEIGEMRYGYIPVRKGEYWGILDSTNKVIAECKYRTAQVVGLDCDLTGLMLNGEYCFMQPDKIICYQQLYGFVNGFAKAMKNNRYGYIDKKAMR